MISVTTCSDLKITSSIKTIKISKSTLQNLSIIIIVTLLITLTSQETNYSVAAGQKDTLSTFKMDSDALKSMFMMVMMNPLSNTDTHPRLL